MSYLHADLISIIDAVEIVSPTSFRILGQQYDVYAEAGAGAGDDAPRVIALADQLYERLYSRPSEPGAALAASWLSHRDFLASLSAANCGLGTWESGWTIRQAARDGQFEMQGHDLILWAAAANVRPESGRFAAGETCRVRLPKEFRYLMKGYYFALGDAPDDDNEPRDPAILDPQRRYYWHLTSQAAAPLLAAATSMLNAASVPFRLKVLSDPDAYTRADAGVLYLRRRHALVVGDAIARIHEAVAAGLRQEIPLLTFRLADGLAVAESPPTGSYGQHRCRLIASALWRSHACGDDSRQGRLAAMAAAWRAQGLDAAHPYLAPGSTPGDLPAAATTGSARAAFNKDLAESAHAAMPISTQVISPLAAAALIARQLCREAHWDQDGRLCNWMGRSSLEMTRAGTIVPAAAALGPDLYSGSAGIALFLAQFYALAGDADSRRAALGAIARSIRLARDKSSSFPSHLSLFLGQLGVAYAAWRIAALTAENEPRAWAEWLLDELAFEVKRSGPLDVIGGNAGAIPAVLAMSRDGARESVRELAVTLGEQLCQTARWEGTSCTWDPEVASGAGTTSVPLTGMSHGASGIAVSLLELYAETDREEFLHTARGALAYEEALFDPVEGNWPDFRGVDELGSMPRPISYGRAWCHGAPGIALARLHALTLDPSRGETYENMARAGLATTLKAIGKNLRDPRHDTSLCHGLGGLMDIALTAGIRLEDDVYLERAFSAARALIDRHARSGNWPSGLVSRAPNPSLMLGSAGTGYSLLRLYDPKTVPSILLLTPGKTSH
jgi:hypothetical protein